MREILKRIKKDIGLQVKMMFPKWNANRLYRINFKRSINWKNPQEMNEKIRWLQFNTDTSKWTWLADKYRVREYIKSKGYEDNLVTLYGKWDSAEEIDFESLPSKFVLKTNHGCGSVYLVHDKSKTDLEEIRSKIKLDLKDRFGIETSELHYAKIKPMVIAEELMEQDGNLSNTLIDYKFYCVNGEPLYCAVMYDRTIKPHKYKTKLYDMEWNDCSDKLKSSIPLTDTKIPSPSTLAIMKKFCKEVCKDFPFVRMDFYEVDNRMYVGEFTFTPAALSGGSLSQNLCDEIGRKINLPIT